MGLLYTIREVASLKELKTCAAVVDTSMLGVVITAYKNIDRRRTGLQGAQSNGPRCLTFTLRRVLSDLTPVM